jgi:hypothetical protein
MWGWINSGSKVGEPTGKAGSAIEAFEVWVTILALSEMTDASSSSGSKREVQSGCRSLRFVEGSLESSYSCNLNQFVPTA